MKKFTILFLSVLSLSTLSGCLAVEEVKPDGGEDTPVTPNPGGNNTDPGGNTPKTFTGITFADASFEYDGEPHAIYVSGAPDFANVTYTNNAKIEIGSYTVTALIIADNYTPLSLSATLTISPKTFTGITFEGGTFDYDGEAHSIYVTGAPEFATVTYTNNDQVDAGTYTVKATISATNYTTLTRSAVLKINKATFTGITFEDAIFDYDGEAHSIYVSGAPDFATVTYSNNGKSAAGTYTVTATISAANYNTLTKTATLKITRGDMSDLKFSSACYIYDGKAHSLEVTGAPSGSSISYRRTNGSGTNSFTAVGTYIIEATVTNPAYNTAVLTATMSIVTTPTNVIKTDSTKTPFALSEPLMWDPIFNELMKGNYTLYIHSGSWDTDAPDVKNESSGTTIACDGQNAYTLYHYDGSSTDPAYDSSTLYTNCGDDIVVSDFNDYNLGNAYQEKIPAAGMNETVIQRYVALAFVSLQKNDDGEIVSGIDLDDYYNDVGTATLENGRFIVTMEHPRNLDNGEQRYFYEVYEFYNIGNTKLDIPNSYFLSANEIKQLSRTDSVFYIDGVSYSRRLKSTYNSKVMFIARTMMLHWQMLIVKPGVHYVLPDIYGEAIERVVYNWYTEQILSSHNITGYELNVYFDEDGYYQGEYSEYPQAELYFPRFESDGGLVHYYNDWHN